MLTIIIPSYNEESIIKNTADALLQWCSKQDFLSEIIFVNNNSTDKTLEILNNYKKEKNLHIVTEKVVGKGSAIKRGVIESNFNKILILDADLSANITEADAINFSDDELLIIGSRFLGSQVNTPNTRLVISTIFNFLTRLIFKVSFRDTQCGFKYISSLNAKKIFENITSNGFLYDIDLILQSGEFDLNIKEQPVQYEFNRDSSISVFKNLLTVLSDIFKLKKKYSK
jgi:glycosyltransferase involved in cell wall biosynthesis